MRFLLAAALWFLAAASAMADCSRPVTISIPPTTAETTIDQESPSATVDCYQFTAEAGQRVFVGLTSASNDASFTLFAPGWTANCGTATDCDIDGDQLSDDQATTWLDAVPTSGAYLIVIDNSHSDADYRLSVEFR